MWLGEEMTVSDLKQLADEVYELFPSDMHIDLPCDIREWEYIAEEDRVVFY